MKDQRAEDTDWPVPPLFKEGEWVTYLYDDEAAKMTPEDVIRFNRIWADLQHRINNQEVIGFSRGGKPHMMPNENSDGTVHITPWNDNDPFGKHIVVGSDPGMTNVKLGDNGEITSYSLFEMSLTPPPPMRVDFTPFSPIDEEMSNGMMTFSQEYADKIAAATGVPAHLINPEFQPPEKTEEEKRNDAYFQALIDTKFLEKREESNGTDVPSE